MLCQLPSLMHVMFISKKKWTAFRVRLCSRSFYCSPHEPTTYCSICDTFDKNIQGAAAAATTSLAGCPKKFLEAL